MLNQTNLDLSGYNYFLSEERSRDCDPLLSRFPDNDEIDLGLDVARSRSDALGACVGITSQIANQQSHFGPAHVREPADRDSSEVYIDPTGMFQTYHVCVDSWY